MEKYLFQICLGNGKTGDHHGQRGIHVRDIVHGIDQRRRNTDLQKEQDYSDDRTDHDRGKKPFLQTLCRELPVQQDQAVGPGQDIEYGHIRGQKKHTLAAKDTVDQRNPDKAAVGICGGKAFQCILRILFFRNQKMGNKKADHMRDHSNSKCGKESAHQTRVVIRLEYGDDQAGIDHHQQKVGKIPVSFLVDDMQAVTEERKDHNEQHFDQLIHNQDKHG